MNTCIPSIVFILAVTPVVSVAQATSNIVAPSEIDKNDVSKEHITITEKLVSALSVNDIAGRHILLLTSISGPSRAQPNPQRSERTDLRTMYYKKVGSKWTEEWDIKDFVDCPGLDSSATFFVNNVTVTDLNGDGVAEVTVPYKMFCGEGVDTDTVKVILRQGAEKYAIRGESLVRIPGQQAFGGSDTADKDLSLPKNAAFKKHLTEIWNQVYVRSYSK